MEQNLIYRNDARMKNAATQTDDLLDYAVTSTTTNSSPEPAVLTDTSESSSRQPLAPINTAERSRNISGSTNDSRSYSTPEGNDYSNESVNFSTNSRTSSTSTDGAVDLSNPKPGPSGRGRPAKAENVCNVARENRNLLPRMKDEAGPSRGQAQHSAAQNRRNYDKDGMVAIGFGKTLVPVRVYRHINWHSYTGATRKLLSAVFSRQMLATHSLSGRHSPAFPQKTTKPPLDHIKVNDIVDIVVDRCKVPESAVRACVTTKCADESKMYRTRQENAKKRASKKNQENVR